MCIISYIYLMNALSNPAQLNYDMQVARCQLQDAGSQISRIHPDWPYFLFAGATGHPPQELPHPLQSSVFLNDLSDCVVLYPRINTETITTIHVKISCIIMGGIKG